MRLTLFFLGIFTLSANLIAVDEKYIKYFKDSTNVFISFKDIKSPSIQSPLFRVDLVGEGNSKKVVVLKWQESKVETILEFPFSQISRDKYLSKESSAGALFLGLMDIDESFNLIDDQVQGRYWLILSENYFSYRILNERGETLREEALLQVATESVKSSMLKYFRAVPSEKSESFVSLDEFLNQKLYKLKPCEDRL